MKSLIKKRRGITLIELIVTMAIFGIIIQVIYSMYLIGNKSFSLSKSIGFAQQDSRLATDFIVQEMRTAKEVFIDLVPGTSELELEDGITVPINYYYIYLDNQTLKKGHSNDISKSKSVVSSISKLSFEPKIKINGENTYIDTQSIVLVVNAKENEKDKTYKVDILLENVATARFILPDGIVSVDKIYYTKYE